MIKSDAYRAEHESFVSNGKGTSVGCIMAYIAHVPAFIVLLKLSQGFRKPRIVRDVAVLVVPTLLSMTVLAEYNYWSLTCIIVLLTIAVNTSQRDSHTDTADVGDQGMGYQNTSYLTLFKGVNVMITCIAILAVDFRIFPRRFAKTETFGVSLMDIGVGTFIVSSAMTSRYARGQPTKPQTQTQTQSQAQSEGLLSRLPLRISAQHLAVLMLGVGRFVVLRAINYQEHVSEYGLHWNFFVTLFCVWSAADALHAIPRRFLVWIALFWLISYQTLLIATPLTDYILSSTRLNIISANKEGICSLMGYIPLYLLSESFSYNICFNRGRTRSHSREILGTSPKEEEVEEEEVEEVEEVEEDGAEVAVAALSSSGGDTAEMAEETGGADVDVGVVGVESGGDGSGANAFDSRSRVVRWNKLLLQKLSVCSLVLWVAWLAGASVQPTSRRLVNLTYVALVLAITMSMLLMMYVADTLSYGPTVCVLTLHYFSRHSLVVFLAANLLTGLVNICFRTIYASRVGALCILSTYVLLITCAAWAAESLRHFKAAKMRS